MDHPVFSAGPTRWFSRHYLLAWKNVWITWASSSHYTFWRLQLFCESSLFWTNYDCLNEKRLLISISCLANMVLKKDAKDRNLCRRLKEKMQQLRRLKISQLRSNELLEKKICFKNLKVLIPYCETGEKYVPFSHMKSYIAEYKSRKGKYPY